MGADDAGDDGQAQADARVLVGAHALGAALEGLGEGRDQLGRHGAAGVLDLQDGGVARRPGADGDGAVGRQVVDHRVLDQVAGHPQQQFGGPGGPGLPAAHLQPDPAALGQREQRLGGLLREQRQVDDLARADAPVASAEQQQRLGQVDRPGVHGVQPVEEFRAVPGRVLAGHVEQGAGDRQRGAQFVRGVRGEPLVLGHVLLQAVEHRVEGVRELPELVLTVRHPDPVRQRPRPGQAGRVGDPGQRCEHPPRQQPAAGQAEHQQQRHRRGRGRREGVFQQVAVGRDAEQSPLVVRHVAQQERPHHGQQQRAGHRQEPGVAERELPPGAVPPAATHPRRRRRSGSRRPARWR
ncbi:hypothetical protein BX266_0946 [Streptomyces sp. TLI_171]|nr:hypothetical protein BX266_0946 [Streptomyces sp. TLI_171]